MLDGDRVLLNCQYENTNQSCFPFFVRVRSQAVAILNNLLVVEDCVV